MSRIQILPPDIVGKIAAGEVIERPASVVKELLENSLDAGTSSIELHLKNAGRTLIQLKDSGSGIAPDDMKKIFTRHSTSKLRSADDLYAIGTLGFRGEALYSIAAIADITLRSKTAGSDSGWEIHYRGSERVGLKPVPLNNGTEIEVQELFFNTPARRKFLKSDTAETNQILGIFTPYTLLYPQVRFLLTHNGKTIVDLKPQDPLKRYADALNLNGADMLSAAHQYSEKELSVSLVLGDINIQRARKDLQFFFINNRPVQNRSLSFQINQTYKLLMPKETAPFFSVSITLPAQDIDVNVHPTKREVKIKDEQTIASYARYLCEQTLMKHGKAKQAQTRIFSLETPEAAHKTTEAPAAASTVREEPARAYETPHTQETFFIPEEIPRQTPAASRPLAQALAEARFIGIFLNKYLLFEGNKSLLVIDQHAAHERVTFEKFKRQIETGRIEVQNLLTPYLVRVTRQEKLSWEESKEQLERIGFATTQWDDDTLAIHSHPALIPGAEIAVRNILAGEDLPRCDADTIARRACRQSVMTGDTLHQTQAEYLRTELLACNDPFTCPHGRPTVIEINEKALSKQFLR